MQHLKSALLKTLKDAALYKNTAWFVLWRLALSLLLGGAAQLLINLHSLSLGYGIWFFLAPEIALLCLFNALGACCCPGVIFLINFMSPNETYCSAHWQNNPFNLFWAAWFWLWLYPLLAWAFPKRKRTAWLVAQTGMMTLSWSICLIGPRIFGNY